MPSKGAAHRGSLCLACLRPTLTCCCRYILPFDPKIRFVILIHVREAQKRIATGRLSHLCLQNSLLLNGYDYTHDRRVNTLLENPALHSVVLYPGKNSENLSALSLEKRKTLFPTNKELVVFVVDGTWTTARKTMQRSENLISLPRICFEPSSPSRFRIRRQPRAECFSTVEAIHQTIELLGPVKGFDSDSRAHDNLLSVFEKMVEQQLELTRIGRRNGTSRREKRKTAARPVPLLSS